jgi:hypothetical protein
MAGVSFRSRSLYPPTKESLVVAEYEAELVSELRQTTGNKNLENFNTTP